MPNKITAAGIWQDMQDDMRQRRSGSAPALIYMTDEQVAAVRADPEVDSYLSERDGQLYFLLSRVVHLGPAPVVPAPEKRPGRGGSGKPWTQDMKDDVMTRRENGESLRTIGESYNVTAERIRQVHARERRARITRATTEPLKHGISWEQIKAARDGAEEWIAKANAALEELRLFRISSRRSIRAKVALSLAFKRVRQS